MNQVIKLYNKLVIAFCLVVGASLAQAELSFHGFASVGGGWYNGDDSDSTYAGYDRDFQGDPVNKIGLQFGMPINEKISATGQLLATGFNDYNIEAEWAYVTYAASEDWDVRVGRLRSPLFQYSDFLDVGYAYPWITPPVQVYRFSFRSVEGVDTLYRTSHGDWEATYQFYYGRLTDEMTLGGEAVDLDLVNSAGLNLTLTKDWLTLRAAVNHAKFTIESPTDLAGLIGVLDGAGFTDSSEALTMEDETGMFYGLGAMVDYNDWLVNAEYTILDVDDQSAISDDNAWYLMLGKRVDDFTYHVTYSIREDDPDNSVFDEIPDATPVPPAGITDLRQTVVDTVGELELAAITLGVRYDFAAATSLKVEVTDVDFKSEDEDGTLVNFSIDTVF